MVFPHVVHLAPAILSSEVVRGGNEKQGAMGFFRKVLDASDMGRIIATIHPPDATRKILEHLGLLILAASIAAVRRITPS